MRIRVTPLALVGVLAIGTAATAGTTHHTTTDAIVHKVTMAQARATALKTAPGKVIKQEREKEGAGWRYSFDIRQKSGNVQEIGVDAQTGKVVENKSEGKHDRG